MDQASPELRSSEVKGRNPFKDRRVRQAIYQAIDVEAIREGVMGGLSVPTGLIIPRGVNGWSEELDQRLPFDLDAARRLLAEAGYPHGFAVTLDCPEGRYVNDVAICRVVADMLGRAEITVTVDAVPARQHFPKIPGGEPTSTCWAGSPPRLTPSSTSRPSSAAVPSMAGQATPTRASTG